MLNRFQTYCLVSCIIQLYLVGSREVELEVVYIKVSIALFQIIRFVYRTYAEVLTKVLDRFKGVQTISERPYSYLHHWEMPHLSATLLFMKMMI